jgi:hypothetical protein
LADDLFPCLCRLNIAQLIVGCVHNLAEEHGLCRV